MLDPFPGAMKLSDYSLLDAFPSDDSTPTPTPKFSYYNYIPQNINALPQLTFQ